MYVWTRKVAHLVASRPWSRFKAFEDFESIGVFFSVVGHPKIVVRCVIAAQDQVYKTAFADSLPFTKTAFDCICDIATPIGHPKRHQ